mmetsp:Transcript_30094/g.49969  ORF Transcript_30094/g.49969 Transcript_30094/m.49969 type:complete len:253 (-) Transcript_30094:578-1336(-)
MVSSNIKLGKFNNLLDLIQNHGILGCCPFHLLLGSAAVSISAPLLVTGTAMVNEETKHSAKNFNIPVDKSLSLAVKLTSKCVLRLDRLARCNTWFNPVGLQESLSFGFHLFLAGCKPMLFASKDQKICSCLRHLDLSNYTSTFHPCCGIDSVSKELETALLSTKDSCRNGATVESKPHPQIPSLGTKGSFKSATDLNALLAAITGKLGHDNCMVFTRLWETCYSHIRITNCLNFKDTSSCCSLIKGTIKSLQ